MEQVGDMVRKAREARGLSQREVAERAGLRQSYISRLESGEHGASAASLEKIAAALGVDVGELAV